MHASCAHLAKQSSNADTTWSSRRAEARWQLPKWAGLYPYRPGAMVGGEGFGCSLLLRGLPSPLNEWQPRIYIFYVPVPEGCKVHVGSSDV